MKSIQLLCSILCLTALAGCGLLHGASHEAPVKAADGFLQLSPEAIGKNGLSVVSVEQKSVAQSLHTTGEIRADENRVYQAGSLVPGKLIADQVAVGDWVSRGQVLGVVRNTEVARIKGDIIHQLHQNEVEIEQAKSRLTLAQANVEREKRLYDQGVSARKDLQQAESDVEIARSALAGFQEHSTHIRSEGQAMLGVHGVELGNLRSEQINATSPITAPAAGLITQKTITLGDMVNANQTLYQIEDLSQIWLDITVYPEQLPNVRPGEAVIFSSESLPHKISATIRYILPTANSASKTFLARAYLSNPDGMLKPGILGEVEIENPIKTSKPFIPELAVQRYGRETFVFVPIGNNRFRKQAIKLGEAVTGGYLVNSGLSVGDTVVGRGSFMLKAAFLKSQFAEDED